MPRDERGRWVRLPHTPANVNLASKVGLRLVPGAFSFRLIPAFTLADVHRLFSQANHSTGTSRSLLGRLQHVGVKVGGTFF